MIDFGLVLLIMSVWFGVAFGLAGLWIAALEIGRYRARRRFDAQGRTRVGLSPVLADAERRSQRSERAMTRHGRSA